MNIKEMTKADWIVGRITNMRDEAAKDVKEFAAKLAVDAFYQFQWADSAMERAAIQKVARITLLEFEKQVAEGSTKEAALNSAKDCLLDLMISKSKYCENSSSQTSNIMARHELAAFSRIYSEIRGV
jgi:hypothetical protein